MAAAQKVLQRVVKTVAVRAAIDKEKPLRPYTMLTDLKAELQSDLQDVFLIAVSGIEALNETATIILEKQALIRRRAASSTHASELFAALIAEEKSMRSLKQQGLLGKFTAHRHMSKYAKILQDIKAFDPALARQIGEVNDLNAELKVQTINLFREHIPSLRFILTTMEIFLQRCEQVDAYLRSGQPTGTEVRHAENAEYAGRETKRLLAEVEPVLASIQQAVQAKDMNELQRYMLLIQDLLKSAYLNAFIYAKK